VNKLVVVVGDDPLSAKAQSNATTLYGFLIGMMLVSKRVLLEYRLNESALNWVLGEIENQNYCAVVNP